MTTSIPISSIVVPGHRAPAAGYEAPFDMLNACHERVHRMLALLQRLHRHVQSHGNDTQATEAARDVMRYFDQAAPQHHLDEEQHVFPVVMRLQRESLTAVVQRLQQDHAQMEAGWAKTRALLADLTDQPGTVPDHWMALADTTFDAFARLYEQHIQDEEQVVYPAALQAMEEPAIHAMAQDMMRRRGVL